MPVISDASFRFFLCDAGVDLFGLDQRAVWSDSCQKRVVIKIAASAILILPSCLKSARSALTKHFPLSSVTSTLEHSILKFYITSMSKSSHFFGAIASLNAEKPHVSRSPLNSKSH